jgi:hypothetical protein
MTVIVPFFSGPVRTRIPSCLRVFRRRGWRSYLYGLCPLRLRFEYQYCGLLLVIGGGRYVIPIELWDPN